MNQTVSDSQNCIQFMTLNLFHVILRKLSSTSLLPPLDNKEIVQFLFIFPWTNFRYFCSCFLVSKALVCIRIWIQWKWTQRATILYFKTCFQWIIVILAKWRKKNYVKNLHFWSGGVELLYVLYVRVSFPQRVHSEGSALQISAEEHNEKSSSPPFEAHAAPFLFCSRGKCSLV